MFMCRLLGTTWRACAALLVGLVLIVGLPGDALAADDEVIIVQPADTLAWQYDPATLTVTAGSTVTWTNSGLTPVTVTSPDGLFDSELIEAGATFSHTFDTPGTYRYFCVPYPHMKGVIVVEP